MSRPHGTNRSCWLPLSSAPMEHVSSHLRRPSIVVMQPSQDRQRYDVATAILGCLHWLASGDVLIQSLMRASDVEVPHPFSKDSPQMLLAEDQDVVEALAAESA